MNKKFWLPGISSLSPGQIRPGGYDIATLIRRATFSDRVCLLIEGQWPERGDGRLVEAILGPAVSMAWPPCDRCNSPPAPSRSLRPSLCGSRVAE